MAIMPRGQAGPAHAVGDDYEQLLETIFTECTSRRRSVWLDDECRCSSGIVVPVAVPVVPAVVVVPAELEDDFDSRPVTLTRWPTCSDRSLELPSSLQVEPVVDMLLAVDPAVVVPAVPVVPAVVVPVVVVVDAVPLDSLFSRCALARM